MVAAGRAARPLCPVAPHPRIRAVVVAAAGGAAAALAAVARGHMLRELDSEDRMRRRCWGYDRAWRGQTEREVATVAAGSVETGAAATRPPGGPHPRRAGRQGGAGGACQGPGRAPRPHRVRRSLARPATAASHAAPGEVEGAAAARPMLPPCASHAGTVAPRRWGHWFGCCGGPRSLRSAGRRLGKRGGGLSGRLLRRWAVAIPRRRPRCTSVAR